MKKPYRYLKNQPALPKNGPKENLLFKNKRAFSLMLVLLGGSVFLYLFSFYFSWGLSVYKNYSEVPKMLLEAKNSVSGEQVLSVSNKVEDHFYLTIPSLKIEKALVTTNVISDKKEAYFPILKESIAHFKGTSLPGQDGDIFLYGHSVLPQFFNTKDYLTIFSTLHKIKEGDLIVINYGPIKYTYKVFGKAVIAAKDIDVLNKSGSGMKTLTLMTCTPPGTYLKRMIVQASIVD